MVHSHDERFPTSSGVGVGVGFGRSMQAVHPVVTGQEEVA
jgi:hypothetical protein